MKYLIFGGMAYLAYTAFFRVRSLLKLESRIVNIRKVNLSFGYTTALVDVELKNLGTDPISFDASGMLVRLIRIDVITPSGKLLGSATPQNVQLKMQPGQTQILKDVEIKLDTMQAIGLVTNINELSNAQTKLIVEVAGRQMTF